MPIFGRDHKGIAWVYYFSYEIHFDRESVDFLKDYLPMLQDGKYPSAPESGYSDSEIQRTSVSRHGPFETAAMIFSEISRRVDVCFPDYCLVYERYLQGMSEDRIARLHRVRGGQEEVESRINRCLNYVASGQIPRWVTTEKRRGKTYSEFCQKRFNNYAIASLSKLSNRVSKQA